MGVFDKEASKLFTKYAVTIQMRDKIIGGVPKNPTIVEGWLRTKMGVDKAEEIRQIARNTLVEMGLPVTEDMTWEEVIEASKKIAGSNSTCGFKRDDTGIYVESRQLKSMVKESTNILFAGERWGSTKKGPKSFLSERVFVNPDRIHLLNEDGSYKQEADDVELFIGRVTGPQGPRSVLGYFESAQNAKIQFEVYSLNDCIEAKHWPQIWVHAQENGLGTLRSQGFGRFDVVSWEVTK